MDFTFTNNGDELCQKWRMEVTKALVWRDIEHNCIVIVIVSLDYYCLTKYISGDIGAAVHVDRN